MTPTDPSMPLRERIEPDVPTIIDLLRGKVTGAGRRMGGVQIGKQLAWQLIRILEEPVAAARTPATDAPVAYLKAALRLIAEGRGAFSRDQLTFATNVIEEAKRIATDALAGTWEMPHE